VSVYHSGLHFVVVLTNLSFNTFVTFIIDFSKCLHIFFSVVVSQWHLPVGVLWSKQICEQLHDDSNSFSEFR
jgi:hypothetical protein